MYNLTIVLIEDDLVLQKIIQKTLEKENYTVFCGERVIDATYLTYKHTPDIVILDMFLEDSDVYGTGIIAAKQIEKMNHGCKFIFISSSQFLISFIDAFETPHLAKFIKPFDINEMVKVIKEYEEKIK